MYKGPYDVLRKTFKTSGIRGCYRGLLITLIRETPAFGLYFASYDILISTVLKVLILPIFLFFKHFSVLLSLQRNISL